MPPALRSIAVLAVLLAAPTAPVRSQSAPKVVFEDQGLEARAKDLLARYATQIRTWGLVQRVSEAAKVGNEERPSPERVAEHDARWREGRSDELAREILESDCSQGLQTLLAANAGYDEAFVLSRDARVVCMSRQTERYAYGDVPGWDAAVGRGDLWVSAAEPTDNPDLERIRIVAPVLSTGEIVGGLVVSKLVPKL